MAPSKRRRNAPCPEGGASFPHHILGYFRSAPLIVGTTGFLGDNVSFRVVVVLAGVDLVCYPLTRRGMHRSPSRNQISYPTLTALRATRRA